MTTQQENRPKGVTYVVADDAEYEETPYSDEENAFREFRNSFSADDAMGILRVSRVKTNKFIKAAQSMKTGAHCFSCPIDQYDFDELLELLREKYGPGLYRLIGVQPGQRGTKFNRMVEIAGNQESTEETSAPGISENGHLGEILDTVGQMMEAQQERTEQMFGRFAPVAQQANPMGYMKEMIEMLSLLGIVGQNNGGVLGEMKKFAEIKEAAALISGNDGDGKGSTFYDMMGKVVENVGPTLLSTVAAMQAQGQPAARRPISLPHNPNPAPQAEVAQPVEANPVETNPVQDHIESMKPQVAILVANAKSGVDPKMMAQTIVNMTPEDKLKDLYNFIGAENCIEQLMKINPEVQEYLAFFQELQNHAKYLLIPESEAGIVTESDATGETHILGEGAEPDAIPADDQSVISNS